jgi:Flp pilus assembly protein TadB
MGVLRVFLYLCAAGFALGGLLVAWLVNFASTFFAVLVLAAGLALAYVTFRAARKYQVAQSLEQRGQFEETYRQLAARNGGVVALDAIAKATGGSREETQAKMRELIGRGVCEMDFGPDGQLLFRLTPADAARAQLASMQQRERT